MTPENPKIGIRELPHYKEVMPVFKNIRRMDSFLYGGEFIKSALSQAFEQGTIGVFFLDCLIAEHVATSSGVGKVPLTDLKSTLENSALVYQMDSIKYLAKVMKEGGLKVVSWAFLGDDDFLYSVSPEFSLENANVEKAALAQVETTSTYLRSMLTPVEVETYVAGWLSVEVTCGLTPFREKLLEVIKAGIAAQSLPSKVLKRFEQFTQWRKKLLEMNDFDPQARGDLIREQAIQELTSFVLQGHCAPMVIHNWQPGLPLIFVNSYPELGVQFLDDVCLRLASHLGFSGYQYGTIHLPGPERLAKFFKKATIVPGSRMLTCGDPKGNPNWPK